MKYWGTSALPLLGIESFCEEIAAAVLADESAVPSSVMALQLETRAKCVVIVAELASRQHLRAIIPVARLIELIGRINHVFGFGASYRTPPSGF